MHCNNPERWGFYAPGNKPGWKSRDFTSSQHQDQRPAPPGPQSQQPLSGPVPSGLPLVVAGSVCEHVLESVSFGQEETHLLVPPVDRGKVLQEDEEALRKKLSINSELIQTRNVLVKCRNARRSLKRYKHTWKSTMDRISLRHSMRNAAHTYRWKWEKPSVSAWGKQKIK